MSITIDLSVYSTKKSLLSRMKEIFDEMFALNYDALIDAATCYRQPLVLEFFNCDSYENKQQLFEVMQIITSENKYIEVVSH